VERFYKHLGKNGIIAHTDADTKLEENYMQHLIRAFKTNPQLAGLGGVDEDILVNPRDSQSMRHFFIGKMTSQYGFLLHLLFMSDPEPFVSFVGSTMATRAFETAMVGGIPKVVGGEDYALGKKIETVGITTNDPNVVTFPIIRVSSRAATGKGQRMLKYGNSENGNGIINLRCIEAGYFLGEIYNHLKKARKNKQTSVDDLRKILVINNTPILGEEDLTRLSQKIHQLNSYRPDLLDRDLKEIVEKICEKVDAIYKPKSVDLAVNELISIYLMNQEIKKRFQGTRTKMIREREKNIAIFKDILDKVFEEKKNDQNNQALVESITTLLENNKIPLLKKKYRQKRVAQLIAMANTKKEALELIKVNYMNELVLPGQDPVFSSLFELQVLSAVLQESN
jgi:hypothetical protein